MIHDIHGQSMHRSCVLQVPAVKCLPIPAIDTQHSVDISVVTQSTVGLHVERYVFNT